jgi:hypothetical protein
MTNPSNIVLAAVFGLISSAYPSAHAQVVRTICQAMKYQHYNQIDITLRIGSVKGNVKDRDGFVVSSGCVGMFTEVGDKLIHATHLDGGGHFEISRLANGKYRLVIRADGFCAANGIILLKNKQKR